MEALIRCRAVDRVSHAALRGPGTVVADLGLEDPARLAGDAMHLPGALRLGISGDLQRLAAAAALLGLFGEQGDQQVAVLVGPQRFRRGNRADQSSVVSVFVFGEGSGFPAKEP